MDQFQPVEELLALIASFTLFGKNELKVALCVTNPQPPGFKFDPPLTKGKPKPPQVVLLCCSLATLVVIIRCRPFENYSTSYLIIRTVIAQQI